MKKTIYFIIIAISFSLAFSQGKLCCKNKACKGKVSCKFNQADIDINKDGIIIDEEAQGAEKATVQYPNNANINSSKSKQIKCKGCKTAPWWKFWAKKKNCCNTKV